MFLAPDFFGGGPPEFLDLHYSIQPVSDRVAKFRGDRPRDLGERVAKEKKHHEHFIRPPVTTVHGRPNKMRFRKTAAEKLFFSQKKNAQCSASSGGD